MLFEIASSSFFVIPMTTQKIILFLFKDEKKQKSSPGQGLCFATVTNCLFIKGNMNIIPYPFILVLNFGHCDLSLRPGLVHFVTFFESILILVT